VLDVGRGVVEERTEIGVGVDAARADEVDCSCQERKLGSVAADRRQQPELLERPL
jgi:hypothetical protein